MGKPENIESVIPDLVKKLSDPEWRLFSGELYKIIVKDENDPEAEGAVMNFKPNRAQIRFVRRMWNRNIILKARQLGFTTLIAILWLDFAMFNANVRCGIIAQTDEVAINLFRDKIKFAYDNLPDMVKKMMPLQTENAHELVFAHNNSSVRAATTMRGGTIHRLHISEFGKICAQFPAKAKEVVSGSIPAVPQTGILVIESTAEGQDGSFYKMCQKAIKLFQTKAKLNKKQYRFHFFGWWEDEKYRLPVDTVFVNEKDHEYFDIVEAEMNIKIDAEQRAWYVATRNDFEESGEEETMLQEYPSTDKEAFQRSIAGTYYAKEMASMRKEGRICKIPILDVPCFTFWDIGGTAGTAIWVLQLIGLEWRAVNYYEEHNETYGHAIRWLNGLGLLFQKHLLPHDAAHKRQLETVNKSPEEMLNDLGLRNTEIVPVINNLDVGIELVKKHIRALWIHEDNCAQGVKRMDGYKRKYDSKQATYRNEPEKMDGNSEGADALRQWAQALENGQLNTRVAVKRKQSTNWRTA